jgi:large conductance mechanosensitive channel
MSIRDDFRTFIQQGNLVQLAVAFVMGVAFGALVTAFVTDLISPLIGIAGHQNLSNYHTTIAGADFLWGAFLTALIAFIVIALVIFFAVALPYARYQATRKAKETPTTKECPECLSTVPVKAVRCMYCTTRIA